MFTSLAPSSLSVFSSSSSPTPFIGDDRRLPFVLKSSLVRRDAMCSCSAVNASFSGDAPDRSAASFLRFASGDRRTSVSAPFSEPISEGVELLTRFRFVRGDGDALLQTQGSR